MSEQRTFVIVGAGLAGAKAAEALREQGFDGHIVLVGEEEWRPYERPPLSKEYLQGNAERDSVSSTTPTGTPCALRVAIPSSPAPARRPGGLVINPAIGDVPVHGALLPGAHG